MKLHEFFDKPEKWTKNALSRRADGFVCNKDKDPEAVCWCIIGAMVYLGYESFKPIKNKLGIEDIIGWNNSPDLTFEEFHRKLVEADV